MVSSRLRDEVIERDARALWERYPRLNDWPKSYDEWRRAHRIVCVVPMLEPDNRWQCAGPQTVDHVKDAPMLGKRAPDDAEHLVAMCSEHNVWHPPSKKLRQAEREYLAQCRSIHSNTASSD